VPTFNKHRGNENLKLLEEIFTFNSLIETSHPIILFLDKKYRKMLNNLLLFEVFQLIMEINNLSFQSSSVSPKQTPSCLVKSV
jgi:hypothetical protein